VRQDTRRIDGRPARVISVNTLVVGSGAAGLKAAATLHALGQRDVLIVTERWGGGASANAGSDKQTYYRASLSGNAPDSARDMARDLFAGGCMHGDIALAEAQHSAQAFYHLVSLGVPFPHDTYGGFPGYRTDHDPRGRGTSAGPSTSRFMVEALGREVRDRGIEVLDGCQVVALLAGSHEGELRIGGAAALDLEDPDAPQLVLVNATNVVLATGGPGGMYGDSVYPPDQAGSIGMALAVGAVAQNLTESQFGLASIAFRWNLSGSYQQVVPRYVSTDAAGRDEREFLNDAFPDAGALGTAIFRKGYQWPFDPRRVAGHGSSLIDLLVYRERTERGRRVYLDFTRNPDCGGRLGAFSLAGLAEEAREYLSRSGALGDTPIERLERINPPAIKLYLDHGIDLRRERLEIAVCAQHNNGGLKGNHWWESNVRGLFPVGEVNGSHGVYRPGGAALNAGQVGGLRAAMYIARRRREDPPPVDAFLLEQLSRLRPILQSVESRAPSRNVRAEIQSRMSRAGAHIRSLESTRAAAGEAWTLYHELRTGRVRGEGSAADALRDTDMALAHALYLESIVEYIACGGRSRGSYVVLDSAVDPGGSGLGSSWQFALDEPGSMVSSHVLEVSLGADGAVEKTWTPVRPIPEPDTWFESVWRAYRDDEVIR